MPGGARCAEGVDKRTVFRAIALRSARGIADGSLCRGLRDRRRTTERVRVARVPQKNPYSKRSMTSAASWSETSLPLRQGRSRDEATLRE